MLENTHPIFTLARNAIFGPVWISGNRKKSLQRALNRFRLVPGALEYRGSIPGIDLMVGTTLFRPEVIKHTWCTEKGLGLLQTALEHEFNVTL